MPQNEELKVKLAQTLFQEQSNYSEALRFLDIVLKNNQDNHEALYLHGKILLKKN